MCGIGLFGPKYCMISCYRIAFGCFRLVGCGPRFYPEVLLLMSGRLFS
ncbi:hypothetical protein sync_1840 [Synechococcus sp. CC9311]|nr:hypothetical protein sync_1840 [Synechococcus sp. CC9311]